jgi:carboxyl-terminal processing protease
MQDLDRAVIIGKPQFFQGLVQNPIDLTTAVKSNYFSLLHMLRDVASTLDYAKKDKNGVATRTQRKNYNAYNPKR